MGKVLVGISALMLGLMPAAQAALMVTLVLQPGSPEKACVVRTHPQNTTSIQWVNHEGAKQCPESVPGLALIGSSADPIPPPDPSADHTR